MKKSCYVILPALATTLLLLPYSHAATQWNSGITGDWNTSANWSAGVPGSPDNAARMNNGGTINVTSQIANGTTGNISFRMNQNGNTSAHQVNWNPGAGTQTFLEDLWVSNNAAGTGSFNHQSGTIRTDSSWHHIGRVGSATYEMSGTSVIQPDDRFSVGEGANSNADAYLVMSGSSRVDQTHAGAGGNRSIVGWNGTGKGTVLMSGSARMDINGFEGVGRANSASGTIIMNNNTIMNLSERAQLGVFNTASAYVELNDSAQWTGNQTGLAIWNADNQSNNHQTTAEFVMNDSSRMTVSSWFELGGGQATFTMNQNSVLDANGAVRIGMRANMGATAPGDGITRMIVNDNATADLRGSNVGIGERPNSDGLLAVNGDALVRASNMYVGQLGAGTVNQTGGTVQIDGWLVTGLSRNGTEGGTYNISGGILQTARIQVSERSAGTLNVSGTGFVTVAGDLDIARDHGGQTDNPLGIVNQSGGTVTIGNRLSLSNETNGGGQGSYNLTGGTLRANNLQSNNNQGVFNWAGGTWTMLEPNAGQSGIGGGGLGGVGVGTTMTYEGNLATSTGGTLDLGDLYQNNGISYDQLDITGTGGLDLTGVGDVLDFWDNINLIRPGGNVTVTGEVKLINVGDNAFNPATDGQFDNVIGPTTLGQFFQFYQTNTGGQGSDPNGILNGTSADSLRRNTGFLDYRSDGVYFVYSAGGQIPEPQTTAFLFLGIALLRGLTVIRRNESLRRKMQD